ncbi:MAG: cytochrome B [Sphingobium sp. SCN 64-10]|nr:MAG: cytochrome B [Sphingobium sp. SCN 64-10]
MSLSGTARYSAIARALHWLLAILIIAAILIGLAHDPLGEIVPGIMGLHKSIGLTVLALSLLRLILRLTNRPPALPAAMSEFQQRLTHGAHWVFYALMILVPLTGWIMSSAGTRPLNWFGLFDVPKFAVARGDILADLSGEGHEVLGIAFGVLVLGHIGAALWHQLLLRDNLMARMR